MNGTLRIVTTVNALIYFAAATYHAGVMSAAGASAPAAIAEGLLGLVLVAALVGLFSPWVAYGIVLAGTLLGPLPHQGPLPLGSASSSRSETSGSTCGSTW